MKPIGVVLVIGFVLLIIGIVLRFVTDYANYADFFIMPGLAFEIYAMYKLFKAIK